MPQDLGSRAFLGLLAALTVALFAGLVRYGAWLADEVRQGMASAKATHAAPAPPTPYSEPLAGVSIDLPRNVTPVIGPLGVLLKRDADGMKAAVVCPLVADRSVAPAEVL